MKIILSKEEVTKAIEQYVYHQAGMFRHYLIVYGLECVTEVILENKKGEK